MGFIPFRKFTIQTAHAHTQAVFRAAGDVILSVTYGISPASEEDVFVRLAEKAVGALATAALGGYLGGSSSLRTKIIVLTPEWIHFEQSTCTHR